jgi:hypothetical protein
MIRLPQLLAFCHTLPQRWPMLRRLPDPRPMLRVLASSDPEEGLSYRWPAVVIGGLLAAAILAWFLRLRAPKSAEEALQDAIARGGADRSRKPAEARADVAATET